MDDLQNLPNYIPLNFPIIYSTVWSQIFKGTNFHNFCELYGYHENRIHKNFYNRFQGSEWKGISITFIGSNGQNIALVK